MFTNGEKMHNITAVIKNFLRNGKTKNCVESLVKWYPSINTVIVDDNPHEYRTEIKPFYESLRKDRHKIIYTPFDIGVSLGRNIGLENINTQYTLVGDNDFVYHEDSGVDRMKEILDRYNDIDIVCGGIHENGVKMYYEGYIDRLRDEIGQHYLKYTALNHEKCEWRNAGEGEFVVPVDIGFNYFLMRTSAYPKISWSPEIKVSLEHSDGMLRAKQNGLKMVYLKNAFVENDISADGIHSDYQKYRKRFVGWKTFCKNWEVKYNIDFDGHKGDYTIYGDE